MDDQSKGLKHATTEAATWERSQLASMSVIFLPSVWAVKAAISGVVKVASTVASRVSRVAEKVGRLGKVAESTSGARALVDPGKYDYLFGKVTSGAHNTDRSVQNAQQLARIGVYDDAAGRQLLSEHFDEVVKTNANILRTYTDEYGSCQIRESLFVGPGGFLKFKSTWQVTDGGLRLTTVIPIGKP